MLPRQLYCFDNGTGRDQGLSFVEQAALLAGAGYRGMGMYTGTRRLPEVLAALDARQLDLAAIYVHSFTDGSGPRMEPGLPDAARQLAGRQTMLALTLRGRGSLGPDNVRQVGAMAAVHGLRVCLYPHFGFAVETAMDAIRLIEECGLDNVGLVLNFHHEMHFRWRRCGDLAPDWPSLLSRILGHTWLVSLNGIRRQGDDAVVDRLDRGVADARSFLAALQSGGYAGPVAIQAYQVPASLAGNLEASRGAYERLLSSLEGAG
jgi:hypothetical protein